MVLNTWLFLSELFLPGTYLVRLDQVFETTSSFFLVLLSLQTVVFFFDLVTPEKFFSS